MLSLIVAMTEDRVIGRDNKLPWRIPEDLARFKRLTMGHPIIMGRRTFDSIGKALPGRTNIVVTRNKAFQADGVLTVHSLNEAIRVAEKKEGGEEVFVIGGEALFKEALPAAHRVYLTMIHDKIMGDVYGPEIDLKKDFTIIEKSTHQSQKGDPLRFSFLCAQRGPAPVSSSEA